MSVIQNIRSFGASAVAEPRGEVDCPARTHAGWKPRAHLRSTIFGPRDETRAGVDAAALQAAIDAAAKSGGGEVRVPSGNYLIAPTRLYSNISLIIDEGAMLYATTDLEAYNFGLSAEKDISHGPQRRGGGEGITYGGNVIRAENAENITLRGPGGISGQGATWLLPWWKAEKTYTLRRPSKMIHFKNCRNIRISDFLIKDSANWTLVFENCRDIEIDGLEIDNQHGPNVDGIDLVDTSDVHIRHTRISTTDDAICLKSFSPAGIVENIDVADCTIRTMCNGFKVGSESVGTFRNIRVENLRMYNNDWDPVDMISAIGLSATDGGRVEDVRIRNITATHGRSAFHLSVGARRLYQEKFHTPRPGSMKNILMENLSMEGVRHASLISGLAEAPLTDIRIERCHVSSAVAEETRGEIVPVDPEAYPDTTMFGVLPAYGVYARHVEGLKLNECTWQAAPGEQRPPVVMESVREI